MMPSLEDFHAALDIYLHRPQVVNRRCGGAVNDFTKEVDSCEVSWETFLSEICQVIKLKNANGVGHELSPASQLVQVLEELVASRPLDSQVKCRVRRLIPKQSSVLFPHELIISDSKVYHFIPVERSGSQLVAVGVVYSIIINTDSMRLTLDVNKQPQLKATTTSEQWLRSVLLPSLTKWAESGAELSHSGDRSSMKLVDVEKYYKKYTSMKDIYGKAITEIWPECTDPLKFVYEDVAIACYLICLWEDERERMNITAKQTFADLGCGNGLLVYILSHQGYSGYGIDVRKRKVWDLFAGIADLRELSLIPSESGLFPQADWLIGNHSDELTPWIPVMAARSSRRCRFFVLPCCPHDFYSKYQRIDASQSVYNEYLGYVERIAEVCGFLCRRDSLRIPSTKKECIIGTRNDALTNADYLRIDIAISAKISQPSESPVSMETKTSPSQQQQSDVSVPQASFKPRPKVEPITNCATVHRAVQERIIHLVTEHLLSSVNNIVVSLEGEREKVWNAGGVMAITDVARLIPSSLLSDLKSECGGLKTLLKNHHHIFTVLPGARVQLCNFLTDRKKTTSLATSRLKTRLCWFSESHPDGCLLSAPQCRYAHGKADLRINRL
ncbi:probable tRNA (uracil-O(2)-)-methyltransferase [Watersipora subatra]|uniref:probable tRNA (uracil-O(2)-)-methyltransferase n=1 Tax=Watersipora subatra TaxID=2589382 RepID=UPI00355C46ED